MSRLHPVFHVVKLLPAPADPFPGRHSRPPPPPTVVEGEPQYEVESILDSRMHRGKLQYLVRWKGYGYEENSWVDESDVNAPRLVREFHRRHTSAPQRIQLMDFPCFRFRPHRGDVS
jgi:Chromo (CHRromatin Organisation MOdifier) domain